MSTVRTNRIIPDTDEDIIIKNDKSRIKYLTDNIIQGNQIKLTDTLQFWGDSIIEGVTVSPQSSRWTTILTNLLNKIEVNLGTSGQEWTDSHKSMYKKNFIRGLTNIICYGVNDITHGQTKVENIENIIRGVFLWLLLPSYCFVLPKINNANIYFIGSSWTNTGAYNFGVRCTDASGNSNLSTNVNGRIIAFTTTVFNTNNLQNYVYSEVSINGTVIDSPQIINTLNTSNGTNFSSFLWMYDTMDDSNSTKTIKITPKKVGNPVEEYYIDWIAGFSKNQPDCSPLVVIDFGKYDPIRSGGIGTIPLGDSLRKITKDNCYIFKKHYGLPIYFDEYSYKIPLYGMSPDGLHPSVQGMKLIANNVKNFILE